MCSFPSTCCKRPSLWLMGSLFMNCAELLAHLALDYLARCDCARHHLLMLTEEDRLHRPPAAEASWPLCEQRGLRLNKIAQLCRANKQTKESKIAAPMTCGEFCERETENGFSWAVCQLWTALWRQSPGNCEYNMCHRSADLREKCQQKRQPCKTIALLKKIIAAVTTLKLCSVPLEQRLVLLVSSFTKGTARICHWGAHGSRQYPDMSTHITGAPGNVF